jgi:phage baseplate assembly protein W
MSRQWSTGGEFPWTGALSDFIEPKDDYQVLMTAIQMILLTRVGERVMLRDFGSTLWQKVFDPNDTVLRSTIVREVKSAIHKWDDRIGIETINITQVDHTFKMRIVFFNAKDPLRSTRTFEVDLGEVAAGAVS